MSLTVAVLSCTQVSHGYWPIKCWRYPCVRLASSPGREGGAYKFSQSLNATETGDKRPPGAVGILNSNADFNLPFTLNLRYTINHLIGVNYKEKRKHCILNTEGQSST